MHKIHEKEFTLEDFSYEKLYDPLGDLRPIVDRLNVYRERYLETKDNNDWLQMIQLLPSSYNQKRTVMLNYEVLAGIYPMRKNHKLDERSEEHTSELQSRGDPDLVCRLLLEIGRASCRERV